MLPAIWVYAAGDAQPSAYSTMQETPAGAGTHVQPSPALTPLSGPGGGELWGADTEARRKRARHSLSGGAVPRTLGFDGSGLSAAGQATLSDQAPEHAANDSATAGGDEHGDAHRSAEDEREAAASSGSSESEEESAAGIGAAAAAAKALARVMRLQSEQTRLQREIQVSNQYLYRRPAWQCAAVCKGLQLPEMLQRASGLPTTLLLVCSSSAEPISLDFCIQINFE